MRKHFSTASLFAVAILLAFGGCNKAGSNAGQTSASIPGKEGQASTDKTLAQQPPVEVVLETTMGTMTIQLYPDKSPKTVANFLDYVKSQFYNGTLFHQVYKNQGIIGGAYTIGMAAKPANAPIVNEADNGLKNDKYTVSMTRDPDNSNSATSVFFINADSNSSFDFKDRTPQGFGYCVFGKVTQGMDVVDRIAAVEVEDIENIQCTPVNPVIIKSAKVK
jgi:cyclophilin family peptidyl-prolyl cis-trans isomerase